MKLVHLKRKEKIMNIIQTEDVAKLLNVCKRTVQNNAKDGVFPPTVCRKCGRKYFFNRDAFLEWFFSGQAQVTGMGV